MTDKLKKNNTALFNPLSYKLIYILVIFKVILYKYLVNKLKKLLQIRLNKKELQINFKKLCDEFVMISNKGLSQHQFCF